MVNLTSHSTWKNSLLSLKYDKTVNYKRIGQKMPVIYLGDGDKGEEMKQTLVDSNISVQNQIKVI